MKHGHEGASSFDASKLYSLSLSFGSEESASTYIFHGCEYPPSAPFALWKGSELKSPKTSLLPEVKVIPSENHATFSAVLLASS